jgi:RHS repeat-associated protein
MGIGESYFYNMANGIYAEDTAQNLVGPRGIDCQITIQNGGAEQVRYPVYDGHGNMICQYGITRTFASSSGTFTGSTLGNASAVRKYDVWGSARGATTAGYPNQRYCANLGHVTDDELGLIYMRARYYEPSSGRFISEDPAFDGRNWYVYCANDPVSGVDPDGEQTSDEIPDHVIVKIGSYAGVLFGLAAIAKAATTSAAARTVALTHISFLIAWFGIMRDPKNPAQSNLFERVLGGALIMTMATIIASGACGGTSAFASNVEKVVWFYVEQAAFLETFMAMEILASGY